MPDNEPTAANDFQIGGTHYASAFQHWDLAILCGNYYLESRVSAYVTRWRNKEGLKDLEKAAHFLVKLMEAADKDVVWPPQGLDDIGDDVFHNYATANKLDSEQAAIIQAVHTWANVTELERLQVRLANYMRKAAAEGFEAGPGYVGQ